MAINTEGNNSHDTIDLSCLKDKIAELTRKYSYDFNHEDDSEWFMKMEAELLQRTLEEASVALKEDIDKLCSNYLYNITNDIHQWGPTLKAEIANLYGLPVEWVNLYLEDTAECKLSIIIQPVPPKPITFTCSDEPGGLSDNVVKELQVQHRLQLRMNEFDLSEEKDLKLIEDTLIDMMAKEYEVTRDNIVLNHPTNNDDIFEFTIKDSDCPRIPLYIRRGCIFEESDE